MGGDAEPYPPPLTHRCAGWAPQLSALRRAPVQHALPMPFGLKLAGYAAALQRSRERLARAGRDGLMLQFGGAAGTLAALDDKGLAVAEKLANAALAAATAA